MLIHAVLNWNSGTRKRREFRPPESLPGAMKKPAMARWSFRIKDLRGFGRVMVGTPKFTL
jgi:hypothetical protein